MVFYVIWITLQQGKNIPTLKTRYFPLNNPLRTDAEGELFKGEKNKPGDVKIN